MSADDVTDRYARFARDEAPGRSALYADWAAGVAADPSLAAILARLPQTRRQPPLVFAVTRMLGAPEADYDVWAQWVRAHADEVVAETSTRMLQTNEPQRCAALLPALARLDGPIALLELGAAAGLCLHPDRYSYRYERGREIIAVDPSSGTSPVVLRCRLTGEPALRLPDIVWRTGIDLHPLDARDVGDRAFLEALVWPGETGRVERIRAALDIAASHSTPLVRGDATDPETLRAVAALAPSGVRLVVTTPGMLPHVPRAGRERLIATLDDLDATWVTIDPPTLYDAWDPPVVAAEWGGFALGIDRMPVAAVDPLGASVEWRAGDPPGRD
ncbi:hypothetical protein GCM10022200_30540 [Microbacterium awajiense]|uniref:DUF2332 domain-containing protein n=1 Tax=Microbacterium awajiense TaxID=415214 RepID=A0ABP7AZQ1_9MICO